MMNAQSEKLEIKAWRKHRGLNQEELSHQSGLDRTYISRLERGLGNYTRSALEALSGALNVSIPNLYRHPERMADPFEVWEHIPTEKKAQALRVLQTFAEEPEDYKFTEG